MTTTTTTDYMTDWATRCLACVNQYRIDHDKKPLELSKKLTIEALIHSQNQASIHQMFHSCKATQLQCCAMGYKNFIEKPDKLIQRWYDHIPHRRILLDTKIQYVGFNFCLEDTIPSKAYFFTANFE